MKMPRPSFTVKGMLGGTVFLALVLTIVHRNLSLRESASREQQLLATLARSEAKSAWLESANEWHGSADTPSMRKRWAETMNYRKWVAATGP